MNASVHNIAQMPATVPMPLPANIEAEQAVLGAILLNNEVVARVDFLLAEHFSEDLHSRIYDVATGMVRAGKIASPVTLKTFLGDHDLGEGMTIPQYLARLCAGSPPPVVAPDYARQVVDLAIRRGMIAAADDLRIHAFNAGYATSPALLAETAIAKLHEIGLTGQVQNNRRVPSASAGALIERARRIAAKEIVDEGISTGIPDLDRDTGGFQPGTLWIVGGRPGQGKSIIATGFANKVARKGHGVLLFSLELPEQQIMARILSDMIYRPRRPVSFSQIMMGDLADEDIWCLEEAQAKLAETPLSIDVSPSLSIPQIRLKIRAEKARMEKLGRPLKLVELDYLKYVKASDRYRGNRVEEIGEVTGGLHEMAKEEGICIVLLCQLNRLLEDRGVKDKRPQLSDLRGSGDIEADADVVLFIHREAEYIKRSAEYRAGHDDAVNQYLEVQHQGELVLAKTRLGATGMVNIWCDAACSTFSARDRGGYA